jgi:hypothetical protein
MQLGELGTRALTVGARVDPRRGLCGLLQWLKFMAGCTLRQEMTHGAYDRDCGALRGPDLWRTYGIDEGSGI